MPVFARSFPMMADLARWEDQNPDNAVRSLFARWAFSGVEATSDAPLRLGVRDGYVNFYVKGQSVAKLSCGRDGPKLAVHQAYVSGRRRSSPRDGAALEQNYVPFDAASLADPATATLINGWIETADSYASAEKRFVDDLASTNPGIIDLEMGLPASDTLGSARVAPRMDIVIAQIVDGTPSIAFWEAKCANNPELRSNKEYEIHEGGFSGPKVLNQLRKYVDWMAEVGRIEQVTKAYKTTAALLLEFHGLFGTDANSRLDCISIWKALADANDPLIVVQPGVVIGNYWPEGCDEQIARDRMRQASASFAKNGHREKLHRNGISVFEANATGVLLPHLQMARVTA